VRLRSIELEVADRGAAVGFLKDTWGLIEAGSNGRTAYLRGTADLPYIVSVTQTGVPAVAAVSFSGSGAELDGVRSRASMAGVRHSPVREFDEPGTGSGFFLEGPEGQVFRFVADGPGIAGLPVDRDRPMQITHVVINARDRDACTRFLVEVGGFRLSDRTGHMSFVRCDSVHHAIAFANSQTPSLNHVAFEMQDIDAVMRGIGRLRDAGYVSVWGPGRHGPGNNVFAYFVTPFGAVVEYTAEVQRVDDRYRVGTPENWKWPPNRVDHWGASGRDNAALAATEGKFHFRPFA
jgi:2,3-dihydroxy-p-cumate/2,3-dihydroxybenzoate 3,4-dioxygenase